MLIGGDDIPVAYDRFRHRVMFPITDLQRPRHRLRRARARSRRAGEIPELARDAALPQGPDPVQRAPRARARPRQGARHRRRRLHGRHRADRGRLCRDVAPLGTALTEEQVKLLWRMARRADPVLRRRRGRPQGGVPRGRDGAAAAEARLQRALRLPARRPRPRRSRAPAGRRTRSPPSSPGRARCSTCCGSARRRSRICRRPSSAPPSRRASRRMVATHRRCDRARPLRARAARDAVGAQSHRSCARSPAAQGPRRGAGRAARGATMLRPTGACASAPGSTGGKRPPPQPHAAAAASQPGARQPRPSSAPAREALLLKTLLNHPWLIEEHSEEIAALTLTSARARAGCAMPFCRVQALDNSS